MKKILFVLTTMVLFFVANSVEAQSHYDTYAKRVSKSSSYASNYRQCNTPPPPPPRTCGTTVNHYDSYYVNHRSNCANRHRRVTSCKCRSAHYDYDYRKNHNRYDRVERNNRRRAKARNRRYNRDCRNDRRRNDYRRNGRYVVYHDNNTRTYSGSTYRTANTTSRSCSSNNRRYNRY